MPKQVSRSKGFRASKPKVKTGCSTCKARRIKCDETRPNCLRCTRFGRKCGGYECEKPAEEAKPHPESADKALIPKVIIAAPSAQLFQNDQEASFFQHYCDETVANLAGVFELPCWGRVILQASHDQEFIRHAVIAIGCLSKSLGTELASANSSQCSSPADSTSSESPNRDEDFVLQHYNRFLNGSRKALASPNQGRRTAMIVCLLIICVEGLQWHHRSALRHLTGGVNLLDEWMQQKNHSASPSWPETDVVDEEIVQQFRLLELESSVIYNPRTPEYHERLRQVGNETVNNMPNTFSHTNEARTYLELIMRRSHHFMGIVSPQNPLPASQADDPDTQSLVANYNTFLTFGGAVQTLQFEQERYIAELRRWHRAFRPVFDSSTTDMHDFLSTNLLKIRSYVLGILLVGELSTSEMVYDDYLNDFEEILRLAKIFFAHPCSEKVISEGSYSTNAGLIFPLRLVADRSRSRPVRRMAIGFLKAKAWREANFWSTSTAQISEWLMDIEEAGVETEQIPEWARARLVHMEFDDGKDVRRVRVKAVRGVGAKQEIREATWVWGSAVRSESEAGTPRSLASMSE